MAFTRATMHSTPLLLGIAGGTGAGKTFSALRLARGLVGPSGKVALLDTERGRALHYSRDFEFDHDLLEPPFTPERYLAKVEDAERHVGPGGCVIVDSASHEWEGHGGLLEQANSIAEEMAKKWNKSPDAYTFPSWRKPKQDHQKMVNRLLQLSCHLIMCFRAKEKSKLVKDPRTHKQEVVSMGLQPIMEDGLPYEMTIFAVMGAGKPGVPYFSHKALARPFQGMFRDGEQIGEEHGRKLAEWSAGTGAEAARDVATAVKTKPDPIDLSLYDANGVGSAPYASATDWLAGLEMVASQPGVINANWATLTRIATSPKTPPELRERAEKLREMGTVADEAA